MHNATTSTNTQLLTSFLAAHPQIKYIRLQWIDYTSTMRSRVFPVAQILRMVLSGTYCAVAAAAMSVLRDDSPVPEIFSATDVVDVVPDWASLRAVGVKGMEKYAWVFCAMKEKGTGGLGEGKGELAVDPRTQLIRSLKRAEKECGFKVLMGFETEVIFLERLNQDPTEPDAMNNVPKQSVSYVPISYYGHNWGTARALQDPKVRQLLEEIHEALEASEIEVQYFHTESADGQYEIITGPLEGIAAIDALYHTREVIQLIAESHGIRATLHPKLYADQPGTACHMHFSINPSAPVHPDSSTAQRLQEDALYGILKHLRAICAYSLSQKTSYDRVQDHFWAGGRWVCWGSENRETAIRRVGKGYGTGGGRWELRCLDGLANAYLVLNAVVNAAIDGFVRRNQDLTYGPFGILDCQKDPALLGQEGRRALGIKDTLPESVPDALASLEADTELANLIGNGVVDWYIKSKAKEYEKHSVMDEAELKQWLLERY